MGNVGQSLSAQPLLPIRDISLGKFFWFFTVFAHTSSIKPRILSQKDFMRRNSQCVMELDMGRAFFLLLLNLRNFSLLEKKKKETNTQIL